MFCPKCGKKNMDTALYCIFCGFNLTDEVSKLIEEEVLSETGEVDTDDLFVESGGTASGEINITLQDGRYTLLKEIGSGGMGKVYLARDEKMEFDVVIKEMLPHFRTPEEKKYIKKHFEEEAKMLFRLKHYGLPRVTDYFFIGETAYIIMEYIAGKDLETLIKERPNHMITLEEFFYWIWNVLDILEYLHNQDPPIIHRDIKPGNIMLSTNDHIMLVDFGVARTIGLSSSTQTRVGTPGFASPEHFYGKFLLASDIFSLGATFHYLLSGDDPRLRNPFDYPPLEHYRNDVPPELQKIFDKMLQTEVKERYSNVSKVQKDLKSLSKKLAVRGVLKRPIGLDYHLKSGQEELVEASSSKPIQMGPLNWKKVEDIIFESSICSVAFSPDGSLIACGTGNNDIQILDRETHEILQILTGHTDWVRTVAFSPDGRILVSGGDDKTIQVWDPTTGKNLKHFKAHSDWVRGIEFSPDGSYIVSGSYDGRVKVWGTRSWSCIVDEQSSKMEEESVNDVSFSPKGRLIASACDDGIVYINNSRTGKRVSEFEGHEGYVYCVAFSPDGNILATGSADKTIRIWEVKTGKNLHTLIGHDDSVICLKFTPDGSRLISGSDDKTIRIWKIDTGECEEVLEGHNHSVYTLAISPGGDLIISGSGDKTVIFWRPG